MTRLARFLIAQLHLDSLRGKRTLNAVLNAIKDLPTGAGVSNAYNYAYDEVMGRIKNQGEEDEKLAKEILAWLSYAKKAA